MGKTRRIARINGFLKDVLFLLFRLIYLALRGQQPGDTFRRHECFSIRPPARVRLSARQELESSNICANFGHKKIEAVNLFDWN